MVSVLNERKFFRHIIKMSWIAYYPVKQWALKSALKVQPVLCDLSAITASPGYKVLKKNSASESVQFFTDFSFKDLVANYESLRGDSFDPIKLFCKISLDVTGNSMFAESLIYAYLSLLISNHRTPNIMRFVFSGRCTEFLIDYEDHPIRNPDGGYYTKKDVLKLIFSDPVHISHLLGMQTRGLTIDAIFQNLEASRKINSASAQFMFIERGNGSPIADAENFQRTSYYEFLEILFQIIYTVHEMNLHGIRHNDLHTGNVWINFRQPGEPEKFITYFIDDERYLTISNKYVVKIYDFDQSVFVERENAFGDEAREFYNDTVSWTCRSHGACDTVDPKFDLYTVIANLYDSTVHGANKVLRRQGRTKTKNINYPRDIDNLITDFFNSFAKNPKYKDPMFDGNDEYEYTDVPFNFGARYCDKDEYGDCQPGFIPSDEDMASYEEIISSKFFKSMIKYRSQETPMLPRMQAPLSYGDVDKLGDFYVSIMSGRTAVEMFNLILREQKTKGYVPETPTQVRSSARVRRKERIDYKE
jgi:hypothetical protein